MSIPCPKCGRLYVWDGALCRNRYCRYGSGKEPEIDPAAVRRERFSLEGGRPTVAAWVPGWYELDPSLEVGMSDDFVFWQTVPEHLRGPEPLVFYNTLWHPEDAMIAHGTIAAMRHPTLGNVQKVDVRGLSYTLTLADGSELLVEAEEEPGTLYERAGDQWFRAARQVSDWRFVVEFSVLTEPTPAE